MLVGRFLIGTILCQQVRTRLSNKAFIRTMTDSRSRGWLESFFWFAEEFWAHANPPSQQAQDLAAQQAEAQERAAQKAEVEDKSSSPMALRRQTQNHVNGADSRSRDWFESLFGFTEEWGTKPKYLNTQSKLELKDKGRTIYSTVNQKSYLVGSFSTPKLGEIKEQALAVLAKQNEQTLCVEESLEKLSLSDEPSEGEKDKTKEKSNTEHKSKRSPDVLVRHVASNSIFDEHSKPENKGALFQVASQFNCLEFVSPHVGPEHGVTRYSSDMTQGPACAIAAGPATVYRNYFARVGTSGLAVETATEKEEAAPGEEKDESAEKNQSRFGQVERQLNTLGALSQLLGQDGQLWSIRNGYSHSTRDNLKQLAQVMERRSQDEMRNAVAIGVQYDAQVAFSKWPEGAKRTWKLLDRTDQLVSQAYCSAISISYSGLSAKLWKPLAYLVLEATYEATLWAGVINAARTGNKRVLLTFVGGGVFGNPSEWIAQAMARAVREVKKSGADLEVIIVHFRYVNSDFVDVLNNELQSRRIPGTL
eukprot:g81260.t1